MRVSERERELRERLNERTNEREEFPAVYHAKQVAVALHAGDGDIARVQHSMTEKGGGKTKSASAFCDTSWWAGHDHKAAGNKFGKGQKGREKGPLSC